MTSRFLKLQEDASCELHVPSPCCLPCNAKVSQQAPNSLDLIRLKRTRTHRLMVLLWYLVVILVVGAAAIDARNETNQTGVCGAGTLYDSTSDVCRCDAASTACESSLLGSDDDLKTVHIAGILDMGNFDWADEIFNVTVSLLNNRSDGFHDDVFPDGTIIQYELANDNCEETAATRAYWKLRRTANGVPIHGIVGSRCSGPSISLARVASLEGVAQVSPVSASAQLADDEEFPYFSRLVAPSDHRGSAGCTVAMLRSFGWSRVSIVAVDTQYARDTSTDFRKLWSGDHFDEDGALLWKGKVSYSNTVLLSAEGALNEESARQVLRGVPTDDPSVNSRVILLVCQEEQGFPILKLAREMGFQKDTVWVGLGWIARDNHIGTEWMSDYPGIIGLAPYRNKGIVAQTYVRLMQEVQRSHGREPFDGLYHYGMEYVADSIISLVTGISRVPVSERRNGTAITNEIRNLTMDGVSGPVSFTENGDRANPLFTMYSYKKLSDGTYDWVEIGTTSTDVSTTALSVDRGAICFAEVGCNLTEFPSDTYLVPSPKSPTWVFVVVPIIVTMLLALSVVYWRKSAKHKATLDSMTLMQERLDELEKITNKIVDIDREVEDAARKKDELILRRGSLLSRPQSWSQCNQLLVEVKPFDDQYWDVADELQKTMKTAHISKLWRIQNSSLWSYYSFHKHRLLLLKNSVETNESAAWHGTSGMDPSVVYNDRQDGFMMQYSEKGFWGRGICKYSNEYAFKPSQLSAKSAKKVGRPVGQEDEREMFLVKLLLGEAVDMDRDANAALRMECAALTVPPINRKTKLKYNTVTGTSGDSKVWVVYENGRAYPEYLIRYYDGKRDPKRTPYRSRKEAMKEKPRTLSPRRVSAVKSLGTDEQIQKWYEDSSNTPIYQSEPVQNSPDTNTLATDSTAVTIDNMEAGTTASRGFTKRIWEVLKESQWHEYDPFDQTTLEVAYQEFLVNSKHATVRVDGDSGVAREVDFTLMVQVDIHHPDRPKLSIRRRPENRDKVWR